MHGRPNPQARRATPDDLAAIVRTYNHAVETSTATFDLEPVTVEEQRSWMDRFDDEHPMLVCELDGSIVGYAYYVPYRSKPGYARTKELTVYVAPEARRRGVARILYEALIEHARSRGVHVLVAVLGGENPASRALHEKLGFEPVGTLREVGHKFGGYLDTHFFQKILGPEHE